MSHRFTILPSGIFLDLATIATAFVRGDTLILERGKKHLEKIVIGGLPQEGPLTLQTLHAAVLTQLANYTNAQPAILPPDNSQVPLDPGAIMAVITAKLADGRGAVLIADAKRPAAVPVENLDEAIGLQGKIVGGLMNASPLQAQFVNPDKGDLTAAIFQGRVNAAEYDEAKGVLRLRYVEAEGGVIVAACEIPMAGIAATPDEIVALATAIVTALTPVTASEPAPASSGDAIPTPTTGEPRLETLTGGVGSDDVLVDPAE